MKQSRLMSLAETLANVLVGYAVAVMAQIVIFPVFGLHITMAQNLRMGVLFTLVSIARSFALRRLFEAIRMRSSSTTNHRSAGSATTPSTATPARPPSSSADLAARPAVRKPEAT